jgi:hypothetical protein
MGYYPQQDPPDRKRWDRPPTLLTPYWKCLYLGCNESVYRQHTYCVQHKCITFMCQEPKLVKKSIYCDKCYNIHKRTEEDDRITAEPVAYNLYQSLF